MTRYVIEDTHHINGVKYYKCRCAATDDAVCDRRLYMITLRPPSYSPGTRSVSPSTTVATEVTYTEEAIESAQMHELVESHVGLIALLQTTGS
jgi:hypothetical protein